MKSRVRAVEQPDGTFVVVVDHLDGWERAEDMSAAFMICRAEAVRMGIGTRFQITNLRHQTLVYEIQSSQDKVGWFVKLLTAEDESEFMEALRVVTQIDGH